MTGKPTLRATAEAERLRRLARYPSQLRQTDPQRRITRTQAETDAALWQGLADWLGGSETVEPDWPGWAAATRSAARSAMKAHIAAPQDATANARAHALAQLARNMAIIAWSRGATDAITAFERAMTFGQSEERRAAA